MVEQKSEKIAIMNMLLGMLTNLLPLSGHVGLFWTTRDADDKSITVLEIYSPNDQNKTLASIRFERMK